MSDPHANMRFSRIEASSQLPDGRKRSCWYSYPLGVGKDEYDRIVAAWIRAYGTRHTRVVGTPMDHPSISVETPWFFAKRPTLDDGMVAVVKILVAEDEPEDVMGVNRTIAGAAGRILDDVAERLERRGVPLTDDERAALAATIERDWSLQLDGDIVSPSDIEQGRLLEIGACVEAGYAIDAKEIGD